MKIQGPGQPPSPPDGKDGKVQGVDGTQKSADFASIAESEGPADRTDAAAPAEGPRQVLPPNVVSEIAEKVRAGSLTRSEAFDMIVDKVIESQLGTSAPENVKQAVRERMADLLETDPHMARQMDLLMRDSAR